MHPSISPPASTPTTSRSHQESTSFKDKRTAFFDKIDRHRLNAQGSQREVFEEFDKAVRTIVDSPANLDYAERLFNRVIVEKISSLADLSSILPTHLRIGRLTCDLASGSSTQHPHETAAAADRRQFPRHDIPRSKDLRPRLR